MRASRWLRRRYYPLFLEEIYTPLPLSLAFVNIGGLERGLRGFTEINTVFDWLLKPRALVALALSAPLSLFYHSAVSSMFYGPISLKWMSKREYTAFYEKIILLKKEVWEQPFLALLQSTFSIEDLKHLDYIFRFSSNFIAREAAPEVFEGILLEHNLESLSDVSTNYITFLSQLYFLNFGFSFPSALSIFGKSISEEKSLILLGLEKGLSSISIPKQFATAPVSYSFALRSAKYFREDEDEISPFLQPVKLGTQFIYSLPLYNYLINKNCFYTLRRELIGFKVLEKLRTPDIIAFMLGIQTSYISVPEIVSLTILPGFDYDLQSILRLDRNINFFLAGRLEKSVLGLLRLVVSDAGGDFLLDIAKSIFDIIEVYILQPGVLKFSL